MMHERLLLFGLTSQRHALDPRRKALRKAPGESLDDQYDQNPSCDNFPGHCANRFMTK